MWMTPTLNHTHISYAVLSTLRALWLAGLQKFIFLKASSGYFKSLIEFVSTKVLIFQSQKKVGKF